MGSVEVSESHGSLRKRCEFWLIPTAYNDILSSVLPNILTYYLEPESMADKIFVIS